MKAVLVVCVALLACAVSAKESSLKVNKTPKLNDFTTTCDECQDIVKRIIEASKDPVKLQELKVVLNFLCDETSYAAECKLFVSRIEVFIARLEPYLRDTQAVCRKIHLCENAKLTQLHKIGMLYAKKMMNRVDAQNNLICEECQFAAEELKNLVEQKSSQEEIKVFLREHVCRRLGQYQGSCDLAVDEFLPELFQELDKFLQNSKQVCKDLGFCAAAATDKKQLLHKTGHKLVQMHAVKSFFEKVTSLKTTAEPQVLMSCLECKILVDGIIIQLKENNTIYGLYEDIETGVCPQLPGMTLGCNDFLDLYAPTVVEMTMEQLDSESICEGMKSCPAQSYKQLASISAQQEKTVRCEACRGLVGLAKRELSQPDFRAQVEQGIAYYVCGKIHSSFTQACENFAHQYVPVAVSHILKLLDDKSVCQDSLHMC